jgi:transcriptional regulator with XRE-family HTH domain
VTTEKRKVTLKLLRARSGKTQADIANAMKKMGRNVGQGQVSDWENGVNTPTIEITVEYLTKAYEADTLEVIRALGFDPDQNKCQPEEHAN